MIVNFFYEELKHKRTGEVVPGCWAWHYMGQPLCDHEHGEFDTTCEDARIEMANIRARTLTNNDGPAKVVSST